MAEKSYDKNALLALPIKEKLELAEALWNSIEQDMPEISKDEITFAHERLLMHEAKPDEGLTLYQLKQYFRDKYGF